MVGPEHSQAIHGSAVGPEQPPVGPSSSWGADDSLREVWATAVPALGHPVWARVTSPDAAALNRAPVVGRYVALLAESAPGGSGNASGASVAPPAAPAAVGVWSHLFIGVDPVTVALKLYPSLTEAGADRPS